MRDRKSDVHRRMTEAELGRKLGPNEIVHHKDEDKANNAKENRAVEARGAHTARHNKTRGLSKLRAALRMTREKRKLY